MAERVDRTAAERMRRYRERQRADVIALKSVEAPRELQGRLIAHGYLAAEDFDDADAMAQAVAELLDDLADGKFSVTP